MNLHEFELTYPEYKIDFSLPLQGQIRIYDEELLKQLPEELTGAQPAVAHKGKGRPNPNQTRTHWQCMTCKRLLRNDFFHKTPSAMRRNGVHTHCQACVKQINAEQYKANANDISERRYIIERYLAPKCALCGFDQHPSAIDMHHTGPKEALVSSLITKLALNPDPYKAEQLLHEAKSCVPLCSNCHRMLHAAVLQLPPTTPAPKYQLAELLRLINA